MFRLGRVSDSELAALATEAGQHPFTYDEVGGTLRGARPAGYRCDRYELELPDGAGAFDAAADGLRRWQAHVRAGMRVVPSVAPAPGAAVVVALQVGLASVLAPCRIVGVVDDDDRYGFAYGTVPGHPEQGEECFTVVRRAGRAVFEIVAFSRPAELTARVGGPLTRATQILITHGYLRGLARHVRDSVGPDHEGIDGI